MKKIFLGLLMAIIMFIPVCVNARTDFTGYYCDSKQDLGDGTFYMTCHIVVTSTESINKVSGELILTNVTLESIKTHDDWTSNNGLSSSVNFTASSGHTGTYTVADLLFTGDINALECEASFMPNSAIYEEPEEPNEPEEPEEPESHVCMIVDGVYYGEDGIVVSELEYYQQCCNYTCTIIDDKYYFDSNGNSVTYEEMIKDCSKTEIVVPDDSIDNPHTGVNYGYIILPLGIISIIAILKIAKKNTKIYKI